MTWSARTLLAAVVAGAAGVAGQPFGHPTPGKSYPQRPGFTLWLVEEFDSPLSLDGDPIWTWSDGALAEGQVRFVRDAIKFVGGKMRIEARAQKQPGSCSHAEVGYVPEKPITSGELRTRHNMFRYGYYEVRMRAPMVQPGKADIDGSYVASLFTFRTAKFKHWREIDIELTGDSSNSVTLNVLHADDTHSWHPGMQERQNHRASGQNLRSDFHTLAFQWLPSGVTWYFDGKAIGFKGPGGLPVPDMSQKIMMNLWVDKGFHFGGRKGKNNRYPLYSEYDWFRFYKWDGDTKYPCADPSGSCLPSTDRYLSKNNPSDGIAQVGGPVNCLKGLSWSPGGAPNQTTLYP